MCQLALKIPPYEDNNKQTTFSVQNLHFGIIYKPRSEIKLFQLEKVVKFS